MTIAGPLLTEDRDRPYEYHTFAVGDRVRVRLSPECRQKFRRFYLEPRETADKIVGHTPDENNRIGTVIAWPKDMPMKPGTTHRHVVAFDDPLGAPQYIVRYSAYASSELELLAPEASS